MLKLSNAVGGPLTGLSLSARRLPLSPSWRRKLRNLDAALGIAEKISTFSIEKFLRDLDEQLAKHACNDQRMAEEQAKVSSHAATDERMEFFVADVPQEHSHHQVQPDRADWVASSFAAAMDVVALGVAPPTVFTSGVAKITPGVAPPTEKASVEHNTEYEEILLTQLEEDPLTYVHKPPCYMNRDTFTRQFIASSCIGAVGGPNAMAAPPAQPMRRNLQLLQQHQQQHLQQQHCAAYGTASEFALNS